jgi:opacity protein-like surface antigen
MKYLHKILMATVMATVSVPVMAQTISDSNYYIAARLLYTQQRAQNMDLSLRPSIGRFVGVDNKENFFNGSIAAGYRFNHNWRAEGEFVFPHNSTFRSGSSNFPTSLNVYDVRSQRYMVNLYRDFYITNALSLNANLGLGVSRVKTGGFQGVESRIYNENTVTNLTYSVGAGASYDLTQNWSLDLGYRFVDSGKIESGFNRFSNVRGLQDEQLKAKLIANEFFVGARLNF